MPKIMIDKCKDCKELMVGGNGEYRCRAKSNPKNEYYGPDYFGDNPPSKIPIWCPKLKIGG